MEEQNQQYIIIDGIPTENAEEYMLIEIDENMPQEELIKFAQELNQESEALETSVPTIKPVQQEPSKKRLKTLAGRGKHKTKDGMYSNVLKSFTKDWEAMVLRVAEKERQQDRAEEEREMGQQRAWEQKLLQQQSAALTTINNDFLTNLRGLLQEYKMMK